MDDFFFSGFNTTSALLGLALALCGYLVWEALTSRSRKPSPLRPPFFIADVIAVEAARAADVLWGNPALLTVDQARNLLAMHGPVSACTLNHLMRRLGTAVANNPGRVYLVLIES